MKRFVAGVLFVASCSASAVSPAEVVTKPISVEEQTAAFDFFYELRNHVALGEYEHVAEAALFPMTVQVEGEAVEFSYAAELAASFEQLFSEEGINTFIAIDESQLTFNDRGVKVADGVMWFDLVCGDPACNTAEFRITELNP